MTASYKIILKVTFDSLVLFFYVDKLRNKKQIFATVLQLFLLIYLGTHLYSITTHIQLLIPCYSQKTHRTNRTIVIRSLSATYCVCVFYRISYVTNLKLS
jgi:hypothetical protein